MLIELGNAKRETKQNLLVGAFDPSIPTQKKKVTP
jgi:hypothetical protein